MYVDVCVCINKRRLSESTCSINKSDRILKQDFSSRPGSPGNWETHTFSLSQVYLTDGRLSVKCIFRYEVNSFERYVMM